MLATLAIALSMWPSAVWAATPVASASVSLEMSTAFEPVPSVMEAEATVPTVTPIWLVELASDKKMEVVVAVKTDVPLNVVVLPMRSISALICVNSRPERRAAIGSLCRWKLRWLV